MGMKAVVERLPGGRLMATGPWGAVIADDEPLMRSRLSVVLAEMAEIMLDDAFARPIPQLPEPPRKEG